MELSRLATTPSIPSCATRATNSLGSSITMLPGVRHTLNGSAEGGRNPAGHQSGGGPLWAAPAGSGEAPIRIRNRFGSG
jgi:hypothetical protein